MAPVGISTPSPCVRTSVPPSATPVLYLQIASSYHRPPKPITSNGGSRGVIRFLLSITNRISSSMIVLRASRMLTALGIC